jgi:hypothetical protein
LNMGNSEISEISEISAYTPKQVGPGFSPGKYTIKDSGFTVRAEARTHMVLTCNLEPAAFSGTRICLASAFA